MLNIPDAIKSLYQQDSVRKNFRVIFPNGELPDITNANVLTESVRFTESLCSQQYLKFGLTEASEIEFETIGIPNMMGMTIQCFNEIDTSSLTAAQISEIQAMSDLDGELVLEADSDLTDYYGNPWGYYRVPYGTFTVDSCPRNHGAMTHRKVTAYTTVLDSQNILSGMYAALLGGNTTAETLTINQYYILANIWKNLSEDEFLQKGTPHAYTQVPSTGGWNYTTDIVKYNGDVFEWSIRMEVELTSHYVDVPHTNLSHQTEGEYALNIVSVKGAKASVSALRSEFIGTLRDTIGTQYGLDLSGVGYEIFDGYDTKTGVFNSNEEAYSILFSDALYKVPSMIFNGEQWNWTPKSNEDNLIFYPHDFVQVSPSGGGIDIPYEATSATLTININDGPFEIVDITPLNSFIGSFDGYYITDITDTSVVPFSIEVKGSPSYKINGTQLYQYNETIDSLKILQGMVELSGGFYKMGRDGVFRTIVLNGSVNESIIPSEYAELWWDEYDVDPIGSVVYTYHEEDANKDSTVTYSFGSGESVYEMKDNFIIKNITNASMETINALLDAYFIPNIGNVNFTPIDLDMIGLPYLEDGDYLTVTAEDGAEVSSYILRHSIDGIQALTDKIESTNGELMTSEEVEL